jgi:NACalpha-BTF3-like transcription factor
MFATKLQQSGERLKEEARQEENRETVRALKEQSVDVEVIAKATGLSTEEIEAL